MHLGPGQNEIPVQSEPSEAKSCVLSPWQHLVLSYSSTCTLLTCTPSQRILNWLRNFSLYPQNDAEAGLTGMKACLKLWGKDWSCLSQMQFSVIGSCAGLRLWKKFLQKLRTTVKLAILCSNSNVNIKWHKHNASKSKPSHCFIDLYLQKRE